MNFNDWLKQQGNRKDEIGELVRFLKSDPYQMFHSSKPDTYRHYLVAERNASKEMVKALDAAVDEWMKTGRLPSPCSS